MKLKYTYYILEYKSYLRNEMTALVFLSDLLFLIVFLALLKLIMIYT